MASRGAGKLLKQMPERDLFANFERMRREMDELFGDVFERTGLSAPPSGFWPAVDVAYSSDPPRAIVTAELAGVEIDELELEIQGRTLILAGRARAGGSGGRRLPAGRDRARTVSPRDRARAPRSVADAGQAHYEDGMLRVELPLVPAAASVARGADRERRETFRPVETR